ncbi:MAG: hypothetical protein QXO25_05280 [Candidatus Bathyarchaeia archaeon]
MSTTSKSESEVKKPTATRLVIFLPGIEKLTEKTITVAAVTDEGKIDTERDDVVELSINHECRLRFSDGSKVKQLTLTKGEARVNVISDQLPEVPIIKARWVSGRTPLQGVQLTYLICSH